MDPNRTPKTSSVWPTLPVKIAHQKEGVNRHFQASWASQRKGCLFTWLENWWWRLMIRCMNRRNKILVKSPTPVNQPWLHDFSRQQRGRHRNEIWHKGRLAGEDDARVSNTHVAQRKRAIPHSTMKNTTCVVVKALGIWRPLWWRRSVTSPSPVLMALCNQPEAFCSDLGDDQSR